MSYSETMMRVADLEREPGICRAITLGDWADIKNDFASATQIKNRAGGSQQILDKYALLEEQLLNIAQAGAIASLFKDKYGARGNNYQLSAALEGQKKAKTAFEKTYGEILDAAQQENIHVTVHRFRTASNKGLRV